MISIADKISEISLIRTNLLYKSSIYEKYRVITLNTYAKHRSNITANYTKGKELAYVRLAFKAIDVAYNYIKHTNSLIEYADTHIKNIDTKIISQIAEDYKKKFSTIKSRDEQKKVVINLLNSCIKMTEGETIAIILL